MKRNQFLALSFGNIVKSKWLSVQLLKLCLMRGLSFIFRDYRTKTNINHRKSLYCFSKYSPLRSIHFWLHLNQLSKYFCHSDWGISKTCILLFALNRKSGIYSGCFIKSMFWVFNCLSRCVGARIVVVKSDPSSAVDFPDFLEENWQTNGWVPLRIDCSVLQAVVFLSISFDQSARAFFWAIGKLCGIQCEQFFFLQSNVHAVLNVCW